MSNFSFFSYNNKVLEYEDKNIRLYFNKKIGQYEVMLIRRYEVDTIWGY